MTTVWISCKKFTVSAEIELGKIKKTAPIVKKFIGQPLENLTKWAKKFGDYNFTILFDG